MMDMAGFERARAMRPLERLGLVQGSGLTECGFAGEPVYLAWRRFLRGRGESELVVDATSFDARSLAAATVLTDAPWPLAVGLLIAAGLRGTRRLRLRLPAALKGCETPLQNVFDTIRRHALAPEHRLQIELERDALPGPWSEAPAGDGNRLTHAPETWCRIARLFAATAASGDEPGHTWLTLRRGLRQRGLVRIFSGDRLGRLIAAWGGAGAVSGHDAVLVFDNGMGGFLPLSAADLACEPFAFEAAGIAPVPATLSVVAGDICLVEHTRRALYRYWQLAENEAPAVRASLARAARLVAEITVGRGGPSHLPQLAEIAAGFAAQGLAAAWPLVSSLRYWHRQWQDHIDDAGCPEDTCQLAGRRHAAPCQRSCPANIDIPAFMAQIGHGDPAGAIATILRDNPFPLACGLVCPAPCESACVRGDAGGAVFIRPMKSRAAEDCLAVGGYPRPAPASDSGKRVGIVGSGPAGLAAAYYLRLLGHGVQVFEAQPQAGGMLRYGIPAYRLPPEQIDREIDEIRALGIVIHTGAPVANLDDFRREHDAVFLGLGTQLARFIPVEGVHQAHVLGGIDFLRTVRGGDDVRVGPRVVVIGGGNVAIDVALTALRQGAAEVDMVCLEKRRDMPASAHEIETAVAEGVTLHPGWGPLAIGADGEVTFQQCERVVDAAGRFAPVFTDRRLVLAGDQVILAVGQGADLTSIEGSGLEVTRGFIVTDPHTLMTRLPGVFAGGDVAHGPRTAVEAIRSGKIAAHAIDAWLRGVPLDEAVARPQRRAEVSPLIVAAPHRSQLRRSQMPQMQVEERLGEGNYVRIEQGLTAAMAITEASRCLRCDLCIGCGLCEFACSEMGIEALRMGDVTEGVAAGRLAYFDFMRPAGLCIGCGACAQVCPTGAIRIDDVDGMRRTIITGTVVKEQPLLTCSECGAPTQTAAHRKYVRVRLTDPMAAHLGRELCAGCARQQADRPWAGAAAR